MMWPSPGQEPRSPARRYSLAGGKRPLSHLTRAAGAAVAAGGQWHDHSAPLQPLSSERGFSAPRIGAIPNIGRSALACLPPPAAPCQFTGGRPPPAIGGPPSRGRARGEGGLAPP